MTKNLEFLIEGCKKHDPRAQRALYEQLAPKMLALCNRYLKDRNAVNEVVQDGFVKLFEKISTYKGDGSFEGWVRKIFVNTVLMHLRSKDVLKFADNIETSQAVQVNQNGIIEKIAADEIIRLINSMPDGFRAVFNLYVIEGYSHAEIAKLLSISKSGSRAQLSRARVWLQERIRRSATHR